MGEYIKKMTEGFDELTVIAEPVSDEDKAMYLLVGLPESYTTFALSCSYKTCE